MLMLMFSSWGNAGYRCLSLFLSLFLVQHYRVSSSLVVPLVPCRLNYFQLDIIWWCIKWIDYETITVSTRSFSYSALCFCCAPLLLLSACAVAVAAAKFFCFCLVLITDLLTLLRCWLLLVLSFMANNGRLSCSQQQHHHQPQWPPLKSSTRHWPRHTDNRALFPIVPASLSPSLRLPHCICQSFTVRVALVAGLFAFLSL